MKTKYLTTLFIAFVAMMGSVTSFAQTPLSLSLIKFKTEKKKGETLNLTIGSAANLTLIGLEKIAGKENEYKITSEDGQLYIKGSVTSFYCSNNEITELDLVQANELTELFCSSNKLTTLNISKNSNLEVLYCSGNPLNGLDLTFNPNLTVLNCSDCGLKSIDLKQNKKLIQIYASKNALETLDLSQNTQLATIDCSGNKLSALNVANSPVLTEISCYHNRIKGKEMDNLIASLRSYAEGLGQANFKVYGEEELEENVCTKAQVDKVREKNWRALRSNGTEFSGEEEKVSAIKMKTSKKKGETLVLNIVAANVNGEMLFEGLIPKGGQNYEVESDKGEITISGEVTEFFCDNNQITHLDVSRAYALNLLSCKGNALEQLNLARNTELSKLNCSDNRLMDLNVAHNTKLTGLFCSGNKILSLDLSKNLNLTVLECARNQITEGSMKLLIQSLPDRTQQTDKSGELRLFDNSNGMENNVCTKEQVAAAAKKNWKALQYDAATKKWIDYPGSTPSAKGIITITTAAKKGETIPLLITADGDFQVEGAALRSVDQYEVLADNGQITIKGNVTTLDCTSSKVTALQVKQCPTLTALSCSDNQLTELDLSNNAELLTLDCYSNRLTQLNVTANVSLTKLLCALNQLESLNLSNNKKLSVINCYANRLTALDLTQNTALKELVCGRNKIHDAAMDALIASLPDLSKEMEKGKFKVFDNSQNNEQNVCTTIQVAAAQARGWLPLQYKASEEAWIEYEGSKITGVDEILSGDDATIVAIYTVDGHRIAEMQQGINIIRLSNGTVRKVLVRK